MSNDPTGVDHPTPDLTTLQEQRISDAPASSGCACGCCGTPAETATPDAEPEKRRGFHPLLVVATIAVVLIVLWFCPTALIHARIPANEAAAAVCLLENPGPLLALPEVSGANWDSATLPADANVRIVLHHFTVKKLRNAATGELMLCLIPKYHDKTANRSFCLFRGLLYTADLGAHPGDDQLAAPELTMKRIK